MTDEVFALLLDKRSAELSEREKTGDLNYWERAELRALEAHRDKSPAVLQRIRILAAKMTQPNLWHLLIARFSRKFRQNLAELEALVHYGQSSAVWEIAYLSRKRAHQKLSAHEEAELETMKLYHDSPDVMRITHLKVKEKFDQLSTTEMRELAYLHRNLYREGGVPSQLFEMLWPPAGTSQHPVMDAGSRH